MKKSIFIYLFASIVFTISSCSKEDSVVNSQNNSPILKDSESGVFEEQILLLIDGFNDPNLVLKVINNDGELNHQWDDLIEPPVSAIVCQGNGSSFAKCVDAWLNANPGKSLCLTTDGVTYYANDNC